MDEVRASAPWSIPVGTKRMNEEKEHYRQIKYVWYDDGWRYTARWRNNSASERIVNYPAWRLDRETIAAKIGRQETLAGQRWIPHQQIQTAINHTKSGRISIDEANLIRQVYRPDLQ